MLYSPDKSYLWHNQQVKCYNDSVFIDSYQRDDLNEKTKTLLIKHFVNTKIYKDGKHKQESINKYLERFIKDNKNALMQLWFNLYPYQRFEGYKDAFQNSIDYYNRGEQAQDRKLFGLTYKDFVDFDHEEYLWDYMLKNWDIIWLKIITYKWKRYIVWREIYKPLTEQMWIKYPYDDSYEILYWKYVWEEVFEIIKSSKIKQILEKKAKDKTDTNKLKKEQRTRVYNHPDYQ